VPSCLRPKPLMCVCAAVLFSRVLPLTSLMLTMLRGPEDVNFENKNR
jgi:hypothetical protein